MAFYFDIKDNDYLFPNINDENVLFHFNLGLENSYSNNIDISNSKMFNNFFESYNQLDISPIDYKKEDFVNDDNINEINNNNEFNVQKNETKEEILFQKTAAVTNQKDFKESFLQKKRKLIYEKEESYKNEVTPKTNKDKIFLIYKEAKKKSKEGKKDKISIRRKT